MYNHQTVVARCTPSGTGALALIRISGPLAIFVATASSRLCNKKKLDTVGTHTIHYGSVVDSCGGTIDQVLFLVMHAPHTFTGHDTVEITCHNNPFLVNTIIKRAIENGARLAREGEFTRQAVENGKIDCLQAEAINELIKSNTHASIAKSLAQLEGSLSAYVATIEQRLIKAVALAQASFEFLDEEDMEFGDQIYDLIAQSLQEIASLCSASKKQHYIRQGFRIALIGTVNAGKSSLFNALVGEKRAIVTAIAGTTRDSIEYGLYTNDTYVTFIDTAGIRNTNNIIEQEGIQRAHFAALQSDIVLLVTDRSKRLTEQQAAMYKNAVEKYGSKCILVKTKSDLKEQNSISLPIQTMHTSIKSDESIQILKGAMLQKIEALIGSGNVPFLLNERHVGILETTEQLLKNIEPMLRNTPIFYELIAYQLGDVMTNLSQMSGRSLSEQSMDELFRSFCIGK